MNNPREIFDDMLELEERIALYRTALKKIAYAHALPNDNYTKVFQKIAKDALQEKTNDDRLF
jgi:hypothetical protein